MGQACCRNGVTIKTKFSTPERRNSLTSSGNSGKKPEIIIRNDHNSTIKEEDEEDSASELEVSK